MTEQRVPEALLADLRRARDLIDREFSSKELTLDRVAAVAGVSKYHFLRLFRAVYGQTPGAYLAVRRIERAQDLLRAANLSVTEVSLAVGFDSLGTFSRRFRAVTGESPSEFQARYRELGPPRIPGCVVLMWGLAERRPFSAIEDKPGDTAAT
ncbi:hypothetical protein GCM10027167_17340 [Nocardia heshunensis]